MSTTATQSVTGAVLTDADGVLHLAPCRDCGAPAVPTGRTVTIRNGVRMYGKFTPAPGDRIGAEAEHTHLPYCRFHVRLIAAQMVTATLPVIEELDAAHQRRIAAEFGLWPEAATPGSAA